MTDFLKLRTSGDLLLIRGSDLLIIREGIIESGGSGGGGRLLKILPDGPRPRLHQLDIFRIDGKISVKDNLDLIAKLFNIEGVETIGYLRNIEITEAVGKLSFNDSLELNAKLHIIESIKVKDKFNALKLLMILLDDI